MSQEIIDLLRDGSARFNAGEKTATVTLRASSELEQVRLVDNPPTGSSVGDVLIFTEKPVDRDGRVIGARRRDMHGPVRRTLALHGHLHAASRTAHGPAA